MRYWLAFAAAGALVLVALSIALALSRDSSPEDCRRAERDATLIALDTAENTTCAEAARVLQRAEAALSEAGATFESLDGVRVRTDAGEECDVDFAEGRLRTVTCRRGDEVVTGTIGN